MSESDPDMTVEQYYEQYPDTNERLEHYRKCGDCMDCKMDRHMAHNHDTYVKMGEL